MAKKITPSRATGKALTDVKDQDLLRIKAREAGVTPVEFLRALEAHVAAGDIARGDGGEGDRQRKKQRDLDREKFRRRDRSRVLRNGKGWVGVKFSDLPPVEEETRETIARDLAPPDETQREMIERLRCLLELAEEPFDAHKWNRPGQETPSWLAQLDGYRSRKAVEQLRAAYVAAFGADELPENRWKDKLLEAVCWSLRGKHGDPRVKSVNDAEIKAVGLTRGSSGKTILPWLKSVCPYVPPTLTADRITRAISESTLNRRGGGPKKSGAKRYYEDVVADLATALDKPNSPRRGT